MDTKQRILLVDDDPLIERVYSELLRQAGFEVESVATAADTIARIKQAPPDGVLLDLFLPKVNGVEVLKFIRSQRATRNLPVIAFSTSATSRYVDAAMREGATQFLAKEHFKPSQIVGVVEKTLLEAKAAAKQPDLSQLDAPADSEQKKAFEAIPALKTELRDRWIAFANMEKEARSAKLGDLFGTVEALLKNSAAAGVGALQQTFGPLEAFFREIKNNAGSVSLSAVRTIGQAVDFAVVLCDYAVDLLKEPLVPGIILIASERVTSLETLTPLKRANLTVVSARNVTSSLQLAAENRFNLIFWDADMPGPSSSDIFARIRGEATNPTTPVVFLVKADNFEEQARGAAAGGFDVLGKPVIPTELAIKAATYIVRERVNTVSGDSSV